MKAVPQGSEFPLLQSPASFSWSLEARGWLLVGGSVLRTRTLPPLMGHGTLLEGGGTTEALLTAAAFLATLLISGRGGRGVR